MHTELSADSINVPAHENLVVIAKSNRGYQNLRYSHAQIEKDI